MEMHVGLDVHSERLPFALLTHLGSVPGKVPEVL